MMKPLFTLGCKVNQYETQYAREPLQANGYVEAAEGQAPDLGLVNTCTVIRHKSAHRLSQLSSVKAPRA